ncbi:hypothetical protein GQ43DRAFT_411348 [Delitschia confertaspora ATCC 74209]|uniref:Transcription factor domain-containing protein n=1 Tax=Delitschia confertaspora ATCC 74209 TaxID=1513339 RepID=A0A9P4JSJ2_9PLEO|nr:hypothetical protein GQ43DRAFT_411348 [Delitschia confertaspora ATCC 74209]
MEALPAMNDLHGKRPCKGICTYWDCKRRKIQSNPSSDAETKSLGGLTPSSSHVTETDEVYHCPLNIKEKFSKLELLFERFACRKWTTSSVMSDSTQDTAVTESTDEKKSKFAFGFPELASEAQSSSSNWDFPLAGYHTQWSASPFIRTLVNNTDNGRASNSDYIRRLLCDLLPSQEDANIIFFSSHGWTILSSGYKPSKELFVNQDPNSVCLDLSAVAKEHVVVIARTLLHLSICIGTLPPEFDASRLPTISSLEATMQTYVSTVTDLVLSSDEQMSTLPGLETLLLLVHYQCSTSHHRQAWLTVRRALNLAHLMGLHRIVAQPSTAPTSEVIEGAKFVWRQLVDLDRFLSLHLRLPFASDSYPYFSNFHPTLTHRCHLSAISKEISSLEKPVSASTYASALAIDEKLDGLMKSLSQTFWTIPVINPSQQNPEQAEALQRLCVQIWHFELKILLHLPFLLRAAHEPRYEYSKVSALQAARNVVLRWFALRKSSATQVCSRVAELPVFIAAATITLDILAEMGTKDRAEVQRSRGSDFVMVCRIVGEMEKLARGSAREIMARRSVNVLKRLLCCLDERRFRGEVVQVTMPYFGTVELTPNAPPRKPGESAVPSVDLGNGASGEGARLPVFSFVSNGLLPGEGGEEWGEEDDGVEFEVTLFEGLEDRDVDGNWVF